jgi:DHA1 family bicyclomycin/chloramphenicol resistance-like MFS transporter
MGALATVGGAVLGAIIGQFFDGTPLPLIVSAAVLSGLGALVMIWMPRDRG